MEVKTMAMRTSLSDPLKIADVCAGPRFGRIGITFCPGKTDPLAMTGGWNRDLALDLDAVRDWGATAVVTLVEPKELDLLKVPSLGEEVERRHMVWVHLPIVDVSAPDERFESSWVSAGEGLRSILRQGFDVVVHCRGGLGRAGTIAARLLAELGVAPKDAVRQVRHVRPGAIETLAQEDFVCRARPIPEQAPPTSLDAIRGRAAGSLLGLAVGDAVGTTLEFRSRDTYEPLRDMIGGGPFRLNAGEWTDDTAMALAIAESLLQNPELDEFDLLDRFVRWHTTGEYSCTGRCFDIGNTISQALRRFRGTRERFPGSTDLQSAGNGSLMRLAPIAVRFWNKRNSLQDAAARQSRTTHGAPEAVDACVLFAEVLADAIEGKPRSEVLRSRTGEYAGDIGRIAAGCWRGNPRQDIPSSGYVAHSLEAAFWCVASTADFGSAVLRAANLGGDADTTAAIAGQLAGALYGLEGIPARWRHRLAWGQRIEATATSLFTKSLGHV
jgi:ADP-ribosyl-[dinitrogen reductase] hydrolase